MAPRRLSEELPPLRSNRQLTETTTRGPWWTLRYSLVSLPPRVADGPRIILRPRRIPCITQTAGFSREWGLDGHGGRTTREDRLPRPQPAPALQFAPAAVRFPGPGPRSGLSR